MAVKILNKAIVIMSSAKVKPFFLFFCGVNVVLSILLPNQIIDVEPRYN
jgi:hypothetical protein